MNVQNEVILLLGKTGAGKSTLGNRLLGSHDNKPFTASSSLESQTKTCEVATLSINGKKYDLVDTPGLFDNQGVDPLKEIKEFVNKCAGGVRAILLVLGAGRITDEEKNALGTIQKFLGKDATDNFIVVFSKAEPEQVMDKQQIDWKKIPILRDFIEQKINGRWSVAPMRRYYNEDERKANENRLMEIKEYISRIQVLYTTKQFEENQKRLKEEQRKKKEDDERRKREYEDKIRAEAKEKMRQEMEEKARQEREKMRRDLEENARREREKMRLEMEENAGKLRREMEEKAKPVYITRIEYRYRDTERKNEGTEKKVTNKVANVPKKENASNVAVVSKREENNIVANPSKKEDTRKVANASKKEDTSKVVNAPDFSEELAAIGVTAAMGAGAGSVVPGVGTALGAATGAVIGTLAAIPCVISKLASN